MIPARGLPTRTTSLPLPRTAPTPKRLDAAHRAVSTALPGWQVQISSQDAVQQASLLIIPPKGMPLRSLTPG